MGGKLNIFLDYDFGLVTIQWDRTRPTVLIKTSERNKLEDSFIPSYLLSNKGCNELALVRKSASDTLTGNVA